MEKAPMSEEEEEVELVEVPRMNHIGSSSSSHHLHNNPIHIIQNHPISSHNTTSIPIMSPPKVTRYKECLKNHAAAMGMTATDGCGEFMPGPSLESALFCSACGCHRNFHRQEIIIPAPPRPPHLHYSTTKPSCTCHNNNTTNAAKIINNEKNKSNSNINPILGHDLQKVNLGPPGFDHIIRAQPINQDQNMGARPGKRFRTKLSREQKQRMAGFADRIGWRLQKQDVELLQHFCQEIGIRTSVFKVWMHNNKHARVHYKKNKEILLINKP